MKKEGDRKRERNEGMEECREGRRRNGVENEREREREERERERERERRERGRERERAVI